MALFKELASVGDVPAQTAAVAAVEVDHLLCKGTLFVVVGT